MEVTDIDDLDRDLAPGAAQDAEDGEESAAKDETTDGRPYAADFLNLSETRVAQLRSICQAMDERDQWARMIELIRCTLRRYFLIGQQHPTWNADAGQFQAGPSGVTLGDEDENQEEFFEEEFNIYAAYHDVFVSVFSQAAAPTKVEPQNLTGDSVRASKEAEKYVSAYEHFNPPKCAQRDVGSLMWTDGRIVAVTEYEEDEEACGTDEAGKALGAEFTRYYGVLESKCPIVEDYKQWPYCRVDRDFDILTAKDENRKIAGKIEAQAKGEIANNEIARMSRISVAEGVAQVSSDTLSHLVTESIYWLRPAAFRHLDKEEQAFWIGDEKDAGGDDDEPSESGREALCPEGLRVKWIGTVFAGASKTKTLDRQVKVMHARPGTGNSRGSRSDALIPVQMEFNDGMGMYSEMIHKCIPHTWLNTQEESLAAITEQFSRYGEFAAFQPDNALSLTENIFQEQPIDVPQSFPLWLQNLQATLPQQLANIQPAMFGGNMDDQKTAKAYQQAKDMSLGVMAIAWVPYLIFKAGVVWQAARLSAMREKKEMTVVIPQKKGRSKTISLDTSILGRGGFLCKAITDQNFPESHTDTANKWLALFEAAPTNPVIAQAFQEPDNMAALQDALGIDIVISGASARDRQMLEWELMKSEDGPIPDIEATEQKQQQKQQAAQQVVDTVSPGSPAPPVPPEPMVQTSSVPTRVGDDHIEHARTCRRILESTEVWEMLTTNPDPVEDLILHMQAHLIKAQQATLVIPPDLAGIVPPPAPPILPGAPGPGAPGVPGAIPPGAAAPPAVKPAAAAAAPPLASPIVPSPLSVPGGPSATATT
jgi:hypothetical protein